jgi:predicted PurR-regulated permease PerM
VLAFFVLLAQIENYVLSPRVMQRAVELSPVTTILALLIGGGLLGLVGALLAIPVTAAGKVLLHELVFPAIEGAGPAPDTAEG